jgi:hypothetical protein
MKLQIHPVAVETSGEELVISQEHQGRKMSITISVDQVDAVSEMLYRARKSIWKEAEKDIPNEMPNSLEEEEAPVAE